jgi:peroxiredoxin
MKTNIPMKQVLFSAVLLLLPCFHGGVPAADTDPQIGRQLENFTLNDFLGTAHSLKDLGDSKLVVIAFLGTECPLARLYGPRLEELNVAYKDSGITFLGVNSNRHDSVTEIAAYARRHQITFPILKDTANTLADTLGADRTPEVFLLDQERRVRYHGRIDDQYGVGYIREKVSRADLTLAIDELLSGKPVSVPVTVATGCHIGRIVEPDNSSPVTYSDQVSRIFQKYCVECHREGDIAPFSLTDYDEVVGWADTIAEVIEQQRMPPWHANPKYGHFLNQRLMTAGEKQLVYDWVSRGAPEGDPANLPAPRTFLEGWQLPRKPDRVVEMSTTPFTVAAQGTIEYQYFVTDPGFTEDTWIQAAEVVPGNRRVVHHAIVFIRPPKLDPSQGTGWLTAYVPGQSILSLPDHQAKLVPAGSKFIFQMHYTPTGREQHDTTRIGLLLADPEKVTEQVLTMLAINRDFEIPAGADNYPIDASIDTFPEGSRLLAISPHMHLRGKSFRFTVKEGDRSEILLDVPHYDFNWQHVYALKTPLELTAGISIQCTGHFDNTEKNLVNPDPTAVVRWGDQTWEEMMLGFMEIAVPLAQSKPGEVFQDRPLTAEENKEATAAARDLVKRFDKNGDGWVERAEVPDSFAVFAFRRMDRDGSKTITYEEALSAARRSVLQERFRRLNR